MDIILGFAWISISSTGKLQSLKEPVYVTHIDQMGNTCCYIRMGRYLHTYQETLQGGNPSTPGHATTISFNPM